MVVHVAAAGGVLPPALRLIERLYDLLLVTALLLLASAAGARLRRLLRLGAAEDAAVPLLGELVLGMGALSLLPLGLGAVGALRPWPLGLAFVALTWIVRRDLSGLPARIGTAAGRLAGGEIGWRRTAALALGAAATIGLCWRAFAPPTDWDTLMYHVELPRRFLAAGRVFLPADNMHVAFVGVAHLLYVPLLAFGSVEAPAILSASLTVLLAVAVIAGGDELIGRGAGSLSGLFLWATPSLLAVGATARTDVTLAFCLIVAHLLVCRAARAGSSRQLRLAGLLLGIAVGVKFLALLYGAALVPVIVWAERRAGRRGPDLLRETAIVGLWALAGAAPWLLKNQLLLGAPLYPYLAHRLLPPWLQGLYGRPTVPGSVPGATFHLLREVRGALNPLDVFLRPSRVTIEAGASALTVSPVLLLFPLGLLSRRRGAVVALVLPAVLYLALLVGPHPRSNLRYLIPVVPGLTMAAAAGVDRLAGRLGAAARRIVVVAVAALALVTSSRLLVDWVGQWPIGSYLSGRIDRSAYLESVPEPGVPQYYAMTRLLSDSLPAGSRTLLLMEARGLYFQTPVLQDDLLSNWPLLDLAPRGGECRSAAGFTHVLVNVGSLRYYASRGLDLGELRWPEFQAFADRCLQVVARAPGYVLLRRRPADGSGAGPP